MPVRAFLNRLVIRPVIRLVAGLVLTIAVGLGATPASAAGPAPSATVSVVAATPVAVAPDDAPPVTVNPFLPDDRGVGECISAVPKPGCGSKERGGWHQQLVFVALAGGLAFIGWRIIHGLRKGPPRPAAPDLTHSSRD